MVGAVKFPTVDGKSDRIGTTRRRLFELCDLLRLRKIPKDECAAKVSRFSVVSTLAEGDRLVVGRCLETIELEALGEFRPFLRFACLGVKEKGIRLLVPGDEQRLSIIEHAADAETFL